MLGLEPRGCHAMGGRYGKYASNVAVMTLVALLSAQLRDDDGAGEGLAALLPVAGMTVLERQSLDAAAISADQVLVLVDAMPPDLTAAVDRIRLRGLPVTLVRDGADVLAATAGGVTKMILVADGLIAPRGLWEALVGASAPRLLAVSDTPATAALERIDAQRRWAGLATVDGVAVAALADLPPDWDPQLALLRAAIQGAAPAIACEPQLFERGDIALLNRAIAADLVEQRLLAKGTDAVTGLVHANLAMPMARAGARLLLRGQQGGTAARLVAAIGATSAGAAMVWGYPAWGTIAAIVALIARAATATIAAFRPQTRNQLGLDRAVDGLFVVATLSLAWAAGTLDPGHLAIWIAVGVTLLLLTQLGRLLADRAGASPALVWDDGALWLLIGIGALAGAWPLAFAAAAPLAAAALLLAVWHRHDRNAV